MRKLSSLKEEVEEWRELDAQAASLDEFLTLALEEKDDSLLDTFKNDFDAINGKLNDMEFKLVLSGEYDEHNAIIALHAGAGGAGQEP